MNPPALGTTAKSLTPPKTWRTSASVFSPPNSRGDSEHRRQGPDLPTTEHPENSSAPKDSGHLRDGHRLREELRSFHRRTFARGNQVGCGIEAVPRIRPSARITTENCEGGAGHVFMAGIKTCGSVWTCAVCSAKICRQRGKEIQAAIDTHMSEGGVVWMVTATIPHHAGHRLVTVLEAITQSWTYLKGGNPWKRWAGRIHYLGAIKGSEATNGTAGWHPHVHALLFLGADPGPEVEAEFLEWMRDRWERKIASFFWDDSSRKVRAAPLGRPRPENFVSLFGKPHRDHGIRITHADKAGAYLAKMGLGKEVSVMDAKGGRRGNRTPWRILQDYMEGQSLQDAALWSEWCRSMKGRAHLVWSPALRAKVAPSQLEMTDGEIAARPPAKSEHLLDFDRFSWWAFQRAARKADGEDFDRIVCNMLEAGGRDGPELLRAVAQSLLQSAEIPGEVRYDTDRRLVWIA